jgi:hypothetical protein
LFCCVVQVRQPQVVAACGAVGCWLYWYNISPVCYRIRVRQLIVVLPHVPISACRWMALLRPLARPPQGPLQQPARPGHTLLSVRPKPERRTPTPARTSLSCPLSPALLQQQQQQQPLTPPPGGACHWARASPPPWQLLVAPGR